GRDLLEFVHERPVRPVRDGGRCDEWDLRELCDFREDHDVGPQLGQRHVLHGLKQAVLVIEKQNHRVGGIEKHWPVHVVFHFNGVIERESTPWASSYRCGRTSSGRNRIRKPRANMPPVTPVPSRMSSLRGLMANSCDKQGSNFRAAVRVHMLWSRSRLRAKNGLSRAKIQSA